MRWGGRGPQTLIIFFHFDLSVYEEFDPGLEVILQIDMR